MDSADIFLFKFSANSSKLIVHYVFNSSCMLLVVNECSELFTIYKVCICYKYNYINTFIRVMELDDM